MRYYDIEFNLATSQKADKLEVAGLQREIYGSGESYDNKLHFRLDESNPYALRVTFNIQHFGDAGTYMQMRSLAQLLLLKQVSNHLSIQKNWI